jgi:hypothetical protein
LLHKKHDEAREANLPETEALVKAVESEVFFTRDGRVAVTVMVKRWLELGRQIKWREVKVFQSSESSIRRSLGDWEGTFYSGLEDG